jgi:hypothetical protein
LRHSHRAAVAARLASLFWLLTILALTQGCSHGIRQWGEELSVTKSASFGQWNVDGASVAVLSATVNFGKEGYALDVSRSLSDVLAEDGHKIKVVPVEATLSGINRNGLAGAHARMMVEHQRTGILNRGVLQKIGKAVNARYVILPSLAMFEQTTNGRMSVPFIGMRLFQTRVSYLRLSAQMWDMATGEMVCDGAGEGTMAVEDVREKRIPFGEIATHLWKRILQKMEL